MNITNEISLELTVPNKSMTILKFLYRINKILHPLVFDGTPLGVQKHCIYKPFVTLIVFLLCYCTHCINR